MTELHGYWPTHGFTHYVHHPAHPYMGHPHYHPPLAPVHPHYPPLVDHVTHAGAGHDIYSYPHPYQRFEQHPAAVHQHPVTTHHVQHHHYHHTHHTHHNQHLHQGHTLHIRMITVSEDITKVRWIWHVTDGGGTLVKSTTKIHETFEECIADIAGHAEVRILAEHEDYTKRSWVWQISDHTGQVIKTSAVIHKTIDKCVEDVRLHGASLTAAA